MQLEMSNASISEPVPPSIVANMGNLETVAAFRFLVNNIEHHANEVGIGIVGNPPRGRKSFFSAHGKLLISSQWTKST